MSGNQEKYIQFFEENKASFPISMYPWYLDVVAQGKWDASIVEKGNNILGVWPYYIKRKWGFNYLPMPHLTKWMGPLLAIKIGKTKVAGYAKILFDGLPKRALLEQNFPYTVDDWSPYHWLGLQQEVKYSFCIDLSITEDAILDNMNTEYSNKITQFDATNFSIFEDDDIERFYALNENTYTSKGLAIPYSFDVLERQYNALKKHGHGTIFSISDKDNNIISSVLMVWDMHHAYTHIICDDVNFRHTNASIYIIWYLMKYAKNDLSKKVFDFEGSMIKSVQKVRKNFGALPKAYHSVSHSSNRFVSMLRILKSNT